VLNSMHYSQSKPKKKVKDYKWYAIKGHSNRQHMLKEKETLVPTIQMLAQY